jgi:undecaprenyl pyrophosphate phosphatase UppP
MDCAFSTANTECELILGGVMLAIIAAVLVILWLLGFLAFHVTTGFIHLLLILAVISLVIHFLRGRTTVA